MTAQDAAKYWCEGADDALATAQSLMDAKRYHHALFFCHLAIEKIMRSIKKQQQRLPHFGLDV